MGLDTVELLWRFEKYFSIDIPSDEAEKILNVKNMVDSVSFHLGIKDDSQELLETTIDVYLKHLNLTESDFIFTKIHPSNIDLWKELEKKTDQKIPLPIWKPTKTNIGIRSLFYWIIRKPNYDWKGITFRRFCEVICFANYKELIQSNLLKNKFEIYVAIAGITVEVVGIDLYEISLEKAFVADFGIE